MTLNLQSCVEPSPSWRLVTVGEICHPAQYGFTASAEWAPVGPHLLRITDIQNGGVEWAQVPFCRCPDMTRYQLKQGDILFARTGATTGKSYLVKDCPDAIFASYLIRLRVKEMVLPEFLYWFFQSPQYWRQIMDQRQGTGQPNVNGSKLEKLQLHLPPLDEQRRIIARIEELMEWNRRTRGSLQALPSALEDLRRATLDAAFRGELTDNWRSLNNRPEEGPRLLSENGPHALPEGWQWVTTEALSKRIVDCPHSTAKFTDDGKWCVDTNSLAPGRILTEKVRYVTAETFSQRTARYTPQPGDVLFSREGTIGIAAAIAAGVELCMGQRIMIFSPGPGVLPLYLQWALMSQVFQQQWRPAVMGTTAPRVNISDLRRMLIPVAPLPEQEEIVARISSAVSRMEAVSAMVLSASDKLGNLEQSILRQAFGRQADGP